MTLDQRAKAYSYIRMSSERQMKGDSLRRQLEISERYAAEHNLELDTDLRDLGVSAFDGSNREKGALALFLRKMKAGEIARGSYLIVESLDRLSRDKVLVAFNIFQEILSGGVIIVTLADGQTYSEDSLSKDFTQIIISLSIMARAHEESTRKAGMLRAAWTKKRDNRSVKMTAKAPSWLKLSADRTTFEVIEDRVDVACLVMSRLADGVGRGTIAKHLNEAGVAPWGGGRCWHGGTVQKLTDNAALIGRYQPHRIETVIEGGSKKVRRVPVGEPIEDYFPRIVSDDLWLRARGVAAGRSMAKASNVAGRRGSVYSNLFSGIAKCMHCGSSMVFKDRGPRSTPVLRCSGEITGRCDNKQRYVYRAVELPILTSLSYYKMDNPKEGIDELSVLEDSMNRWLVEKQGIEDKIRLLLDHVEHGDLVADRIRERHQEREECDEKIAGIRQEIELLRSTMIARSTSNLPELLATSERLDGQDRFAARSHIAQVVRSLCGVIHFSASNEIHLFGRSDPKAQGSQVYRALAFDESQGAYIVTKASGVTRMKIVVMNAEEGEKLKSQFKGVVGV